jgi:hypothetical protein
MNTNTNRITDCLGEIEGEMKIVERNFALLRTALSLLIDDSEMGAYAAIFTAINESFDKIDDHTMQMAIIAGAAMQNHATNHALVHDEYDDFAIVLPANIKTSH